MRPPSPPGRWSIGTIERQRATRQSHCSCFEHHVWPRRTFTKTFASSHRLPFLVVDEWVIVKVKHGQLLLPGAKKCPNGKTFASSLSHSDFERSITSSRTSPVCGNRNCYIYSKPLHTCVHLNQCFGKANEVSVAASVIRILGMSSVPQESTT